MESIYSRTLCAQEGEWFEERKRREGEEQETDCISDRRRIEASTS
jgi:hypothetical protein